VIVLIFGYYSTYFVAWVEGGKEMGRQGRPEEEREPEEVGRERGSGLEGDLGQRGTKACGTGNCEIRGTKGGDPGEVQEEGGGAGLGHS